jgi:hypothetical protein
MHVVSMTIALARPKISIGLPREQIAIANYWRLRSGAIGLDRVPIQGLQLIARLHATLLLPSGSSVKLVHDAAGGQKALRTQYTYQGLVIFQAGLLLAQILEANGIPYMFERRRRYENWLLVCFVHLAALFVFYALTSSQKSADFPDIMIFADLLISFGFVPLLLFVPICVFSKSDFATFLFSSCVIAGSIPFLLGRAIAMQAEKAGSSAGGYELLLPWFFILWAFTFLAISMLHFIGGIKWWNDRN